MFQSLRPNSQIYILHKGNKPSLDMGYIISVSVPKAKYSVTPAFTQQQETVVDIVAKVNNQSITYNNVPATLDVADSYSGLETITLADNKEAMNEEILNLKSKSQEIINGFDYHNQLLLEYDNILQTLNPEIAEKQQQKDEINTLKQQVKDMSVNIEELMKTNRMLIDKLSNK